MALVIVLLGAALVALSNFFMRRSVDAGGSTRIYLVVQLLISVGVATLLNPVRTGNYSWSPLAAALGLVGGLFLGTMMWSFGRALERGPPGFSVAILNSASVMPALIMMALFGSAWGFLYEWWHAAGSACVVVGLFWAGWGRRQGSSSWVAFVALAFFAHILLLCFVQWRTLLASGGESWQVPWRLAPEEGQWFLPILFFTAVLMQAVSWLRQEPRYPKRAEILYGVLGGISNGSGIYGLFLAAESATPWQSAMIFPLYAVAIIVICNIWGQWVYREKVNWAANALCLGGIALGTIDWSAF